MEDYVETKLCKKCGEVKPYTDFYVRKLKNSLGRESQCISCKAVSLKVRKGRPLGRLKRNSEDITSDIESQSKVCCVCMERKAFDKFYNFKQSSDCKSYRCKDCDRKAQLKWRRNNPRESYLSDRRINLKMKYGMSMDDYDNLLDKQDGCCAICGIKAEDNKVKQGGVKQTHSLSVDHCHSTGKIRGLLCNQCNRAIGMLGDNISGLYKAYVYVVRAYEKNMEVE